MTEEESAGWKTVISEFWHEFWPVFVAVFFIFTYVGAHGMLLWWVDGAEGLPFVETNEFGYMAFGLIYAALRLKPPSRVPGSTERTSE